MCICATCDMYKVKCTQNKQKIKNIFTSGKLECVIWVQFIEIATLEQTNGIKKHLKNPLMLCMWSAFFSFLLLLVN